MVWGGVSHPLQLTTGLVLNSFIMTNPTLAGELMFLIPKVSILSEQTQNNYRTIAKIWKQEEKGKRSQVA